MKWIIGMMVIVGISAATIATQERDYIRITDSVKGLQIGGDGYMGAEALKLMDNDGKRVEHMMQAIEVMEERGYELVTVYGNDMGHFAVMRK